MEVVVAYFNALLLCLPVGTEENYKTNPVRILKPEISVHFLVDRPNLTVTESELPGCKSCCEQRMLLSTVPGTQTLFLSVRAPARTSCQLR